MGNRHSYIALVGTLIIVGLISNVQAGVLSGQDLLDICEPAPVDPAYRLKLSECAGYVIGVSDTFDCENKTLGFTWDSAKFNNQGALIDYVVEWLHFHPNVLHYQASGLVASALSGKYPCPSSVAAQ
jgi:hypothetical protein